MCVSLDQLLQQACMTANEKKKDLNGKNRDVEGRIKLD